MGEEQVSNIRETNRTLLKLNRRFLRDEDVDNRRSVAKNWATPETITEIANKLKTKSSITVEELHFLKNGLIEDQKYTDIILNTHGAIKGLVRELTGNEVRKQVQAAGCFCNLGLSNSKACVAVVKAAGPYLVANLDSLSSELAVTCTWAIGNLAGSGIKASTYLTSQGALTKLTDSLNSSNEERKDASLYAITHFGMQLMDELRTEHLTNLLEILSTSEINITTSQLLFILSCHNEFNLVLPQKLIEKILANIPSSVNLHLTNKCDEDCIILNLVRTLGNVSLNNTIENLISVNLLNVISCFKDIILNDDNLSRAVLWLFGNLFHYNSKSDLIKELLNSW